MPACLACRHRHAAAVLGERLVRLRSGSLGVGLGDQFDCHAVGQPASPNDLLLGWRRGHVGAGERGKIGDELRAALFGQAGEKLFVNGLRLLLGAVERGPAFIGEPQAPSAGISLVILAGEQATFFEALADIGDGAAVGTDGDAEGGLRLAGLVCEGLQNSELAGGDAASLAS